MISTQFRSIPVGAAFPGGGRADLRQRPFATSMAKGREMSRRRNSTHRAVDGLDSSSLAAGDLRAKAADLAEIRGYVAHNSMSDYYTHGLLACGLSTQPCATSSKGRGPMIAAPSAQLAHTRRHGLYEHQGQSMPYYGALHMVAGDGQAYMRIFGDHKGDAEGKIPGRPGYFKYNTWNAAQLAIQEMFETGIAPETSAQLLEKLAMFLLPFYSALEADGALVQRTVLED